MPGIKKGGWKSFPTSRIFCSIEMISESFDLFLTSIPLCMAISKNLWKIRHKAVSTLPMEYEQHLSQFTHQLRCHMQPLIQAQFCSPVGSYIAASELDRGSFFNPKISTCVFFVPVTPMVLTSFVSAVPIVQVHVRRTKNYSCFQDVFQIMHTMSTY